MAKKKKKKTIKKKMGKRYNQGKLRWRNFPMFLIRPLIEVAHYGESKYNTFNFLDGMTVLNSYDCLMRHLDSFIDPMQSDYDEFQMIDGKKVAGSGKHHLAHVAWNALVCLYMVLARPELDDRWQPNNKK